VQPGDHQGVEGVPHDVAGVAAVGTRAGDQRAQVDSS
jgi:hypothetical protein